MIIIRIEIVLEIDPLGKHSWLGTMLQEVEVTGLKLSFGTNYCLSKMDFPNVYRLFRDEDFTRELA